MHSAMIENLFGEALTIRRKSNNSKKLWAKAARVAKGVPEVMVKITGFGKGASHVKSHLTYISRHGKVELETDTGEILDDKESITEHVEHWKNDIEDRRQRKNQRDTMHLILSMPNHVDEEAVRRATREFTRETFGDNHYYVFALHTDSSNPHCHVTVRCDGKDGRKLNPRKADLQAWREAFAEKIRAQGYEAEATPRRARGIVRKAEKTVIRHIEAGDKTHKPRVSKVRAKRTREAAKELANRHIPVVHPWEDALKARQAKVRQSWLEAAEALEKQNTLESADLSKRIREMVTNMPPIETERQKIIGELAQTFRRQPAIDRQSLPEKADQIAAKPKSKDRNLER